MYFLFSVAPLLLWYQPQPAHPVADNPHQESQRLEVTQPLEVTRPTEDVVDVLLILDLEDQLLEDLRPWSSLEMKARHIEYDWWAEPNAGSFINDVTKNYLPPHCNDKMTHRTRHSKCHGQNAKPKT